MRHRPGGPICRSLVPLDLRLLTGGHAGADPAVYEPEDDKYGTAVGPRLAEKVFQVSSELALWANTLPKLPDRAAPALLLMRHGLGQLRTDPASPGRRR